MGSNLRSTRNNRRWHWREEHLDRAAISTDIVLIGPELTALGGDALQILLSRSIGIANLEKETLLANGLAMELLDDLLTDITVLEAASTC